MLEHLKAHLPNILIMIQAFLSTLKHLGQTSNCLVDPGILLYDWIQIMPQDETHMHTRAAKTTCIRNSMSQRLPYPSFRPGHSTRIRGGKACHIGRNNKVLVCVHFSIPTTRCRTAFAHALSTQHNPLTQNSSVSLQWCVGTLPRLYVHDVGKHEALAVRR